MWQYLNYKFLPKVLWLIYSIPEMYSWLVSVSIEFEEH